MKWPSRVWVQRYGRGEMYAHVSKKACRDEFGDGLDLRCYVLQAPKRPKAKPARRRGNP